MSGALNLHADIARELFLEYMAQQPGNAQEAARAAIEGADTFIEAYAKRGAVADEPAAPKKLKGCKACFGSGGKVGMPCKVCAGTGKVEG
jgi:DnaJ-class molecular chaperone